MMLRLEVESQACLEYAVVPSSTFNAASQTDCMPSVRH